jgi:hypothetical protein
MFRFFLSDAEKQKNDFRMLKSEVHRISVRKREQFFESSKIHPACSPEMQTLCGELDMILMIRKQIIDYDFISLKSAIHKLLRELLKEDQESFYNQGKVGIASELIDTIHRIQDIRSFNQILSLINI